VVVVKKQAAKAAPKRAAPQKTFSMRHLWRMALWGGTAASALLLAVMTTRSEVGSERVASALSSLRGSRQVAARSFDAQAETRRLSQAVSGLAAENEQLRARLAEVEHNMDDITGSVTRQIEAVKAQSVSPWPAGAAPVPATPAVIASIVLPKVPPPAGLDTPLPLLPPGAPAAQPASVAAVSPGSPAGYGVDIGSALSLQVLRARWLGIRSAHPQLFNGLTATAVLREIPQTNRAELRLVVGPLVDAEAAAQVCASLAPFRLFCQPAAFDPHNVALQ
jgi:hypothetical protein